MSVVGRIPLLSVVLGQAYELAVHGLDLVSCGAAPPPADVLQSGLAALADVTGGLAASMDITGGVTLLGASAATTIVQAGTVTARGIDRVFEIRPGARAIMRRLTIRFGEAFEADGAGHHPDAGA